MEAISVSDKVMVRSGNVFASLFYLGDRRKFAGQVGVVVGIATGEYSGDVFYTVFFDGAGEGVFTLDELGMLIV